LMEVEILDKKRTVVGDGIHFYVKIKARVNLDKTEEMAKRVKEKDVIEDYKRIQEAYDKSQKEIEELKKQLAQAKGEKEKKEVEAKITDEERFFQAFELYEKGHTHLISKEANVAIEAFTSAIALNLKYAFVYYYRGLAYFMKSQYGMAIEDVNRAVTLDPKYANAYIIRGLISFENREYDKAVSDFQKACDLGNKLGCETLQRIVK